MIDDLIRNLLEAGVHFGHQTKRWNPKMKRFIFGQRSGIYIIDLEKTVECLNKAMDFAKDLGMKGGKILFVGTKKQAQMTIEEQAKRSEMFYVSNRWLGGLLTNFQTVKKSLDRLVEIEQMVTNGIWENLKKKETSRLTKEKEKLLKDLGGIRNMETLPQAIFIVDPKKEEIAVKEARKLKIPIIAVIDTNADPDLIDFPIPANDDALKSIHILTSLVVDSFNDGRKEFLTSEAIKRKTITKQEQSAPEQASADASTASQNAAS